MKYVNLSIYQHGADLNQLGYTTAIALTCALAAGLIVAGAFDYRLFGGPSMWAGLSCTFFINIIPYHLKKCSLLLFFRGCNITARKFLSAMHLAIFRPPSQIMRNFSRLVRRNEREATLQEPAAWNPLLQSDNNMSLPAVRRNHALSQYSISTTSSSTPLTRSKTTRFTQQSLPAEDNPFADFEVVLPRQQVESWQPQPEVQRRATQVTSRSSMSRYSYRTDIGQVLPEDVMPPEEEDQLAASRPNSEKR